MKVAIYCRLSEEDKDKHCETDDSNSIQNQKNMLLQYSMEHGWDVYDIYSDDDYTGADRNRPEFKRLLSDAEQHKFDTILCKTQSRFTRELELVEKYIHGLFPLWGIRFISVVDNADTENKGNKKSRQINGLINEWYLEDMSENIKSVLTNRRENGYHIGAFAPFGYMKDPAQKGHLIIDEDAAAIVREIFLMYVTGMGKSAIAKDLNERHIPNPTEYKHIHGYHVKSPQNRCGTLWSYYTISQIVSNEVYIGNMVQGRYGSVSYKTKKNKPKPKDKWIRVEHTHEAIIEKPLWDKAQSISKTRSKPFGNGELGLFSGKARCMYCNCSMRTKKNNDKYYLQCSNRYKSSSACVGSFIPVAQLEKAVIAEINQLSELYLDTNILEKRITLNTDLVSKRNAIENRITDYKERLDECCQGIRGLYIDKVKNIITDEDFVILSETLCADRDWFNQAIASAEKRIAEINAKIELGDNRKKIIEKYTNINRLNRIIVTELIDYIAIGRRDPETNQVPIEIHWNF